MVVSWDDLRRWNPAELAWSAQRLTDSAHSLTEQAERVVVLFDDMEWHGSAADAARSAVVGVRDDLVERARVLGVVGRCVGDAATAMYPLVASAAECEDDAVLRSMAIGPGGDVVDTLSVYSASAEAVWGMARDRLRWSREISERVAELVSRATELDDTTAVLLERVEFEAGLPEHTDAPSPKTAAANAAFWDASTQAERTGLLVGRPEVLGNLDGVPAHVRDSANRRMLTLERTRLEGVASELRSRLSDNIFGGLLDNADAGLAETEKRLAALDAISATLERGDRQLLVLDNSSGSDTLAAIAVGNVDTATHVAVFVPGMDSDVHGDLLRYDGDMASLKSTVEQLIPPSDTAAVVTWMDYEAPHTGWSLLDPNRSVIGSGAAVAGAAGLGTFLDGLDASRRDDPHLSLLGHSYGSLTAAHAVRDAAATGVDEMVAVGSPGLGVGTVHELAIPPGHLFVGEADNDAVADLGAFGTDPSALDGIRTLPTGDDGDLRASEGHGDYFTEGTASHRAIASVVAGRPVGG